LPLTGGVSSMVFNRSNGVYRSVVAALAGLILLTAANQPTKQSKATESEQKNTGAIVKTSPPPETPKPPYWPYGNRYSDACYNAKDHDSADLCAQWRAAIAAEKAAGEARIATIASVIATILSAIGVVGLIYTLWQTHGALGEARRGNRLNLQFEKRARRQAREAARETKRALDIAERNADAAAAQVKVAHDVAERQLRPYLYVEKVEPVDLDPMSNIILIPIRNFGKTPAINVRACATYRRQKPKEVAYSNVSLSEDHATRDVPPTHAQTIHSTINVEDWASTVAKITTGEIVLVIYFGYEYSGIDGSKYGPFTETIIFGQNGPRTAIPNDYLANQNATTD
jgi:hypothetical protein